MSFPHITREFSIYHERKHMYIEITDGIAIIIALSLSITLIITTALHNARLTRQAKHWKYQYDELAHYMENGE